MSGQVESGKSDSPVRLKGLRELASKYRLLLCDVWGVLHNGVRPYPDCILALQNFRENGGTVVMITNAPRPRDPVYAQLENLGVPRSAYDAVVTSGDVTRTLLEGAPSKLLHIGPDKDLPLFEGLGIERCSEELAEGVICTGLWDERKETPEDYRPLMKRLADRGLPFICANPDIVVEVGDHLEYCAGAIAQEYERAGGVTHIAGKPHSPIYEAAIAEAKALTGTSFKKNEILAVGDGLPTDIRGATDFGIDVIYISSGIHAREYGPADNPDHARLADYLKSEGAKPTAYMPGLKW